MRSLFLIILSIFLFSFSLGEKEFPMGLIYTVEIGSYQGGILVTKNMEEVGEVYVEKEKGGLDTYRIGAYKKYDAAEVAQKKLAKMGYKLSEIKAFYNREPLNVTAAVEVQNIIEKVEKRTVESITVEEMNLLIESLGQ